jgi:hypothetical protein
MSRKLLQDNIILHFFFSCFISSIVLFFGLRKKLQSKLFFADRGKKFEYFFYFVLLSICLSVRLFNIVLDFF